MLIAHSPTIKHPNLDKPGLFLLSKPGGGRATNPRRSRLPGRPGNQLPTNSSGLPDSLNINAPHVFHVREMGAASKNKMDRWLLGPGGLALPLLSLDDFAEPLGGSLSSWGYA